MCSEVLPAPVSLRCLLSTDLSAYKHTRADGRRRVGGEGERGRVMYAVLFIGSHPCQCFVLISL